MEGQELEIGRDVPSFSLIFPTYNPGPILGRTWQQVERFLHETSETWEVLFVCDGCSDGSAERLAEWTRHEAAPVRILSYSPNHGKGYAVRLGLQAARGHYRIFADVDLAYSFDDIRRLARKLRDGADVAIASRTHPESQMTLPTRLQAYAYRRHLQSLAFSQLVRWLLPVKERDTQAGLKGMTAEAARRMVPHLTCNGFGFDCELLTAAARLGLSVAEVPVSVRYEDRVSTTNVVSMGRMIGEIWQIRRAWKQAPATVLSVPAEPTRRQAA
jgi:glycosyltransferase involved in cell wall biosynthesis